MDAWMQQPGAWVLGHRAVVVGHDGRCHVECSCGLQSEQMASVDRACWALVTHLQRVVRDGAPVMGGDDGLAGVREPRRPLRPLGSLSAVIDPDDVTRSA